MTKRLVLLPALCSSLLFAASCQKEEPFEKPTGPDLSELVAAYDEPTAELTPESAAVVLDTVDALIAQLQELGLQEQLLDAINTTIDEQLSQGSEQGATTQGV